MTQVIVIVTGGSGASAEQVVHTVLAQFPPNSAQVITIPHVRRTAQIDEAVQRAAANHSLLVHTLVEAPLRSYLVTQAQAAGLTAIDLMGPLLEHLSQMLGQQPFGQPGLYRQLNRAYFDRVAAIDFSMAHDDGKNPAGLPRADLVLAGVSRAGKTPLSLYLAVLGWKVANVPLVPGLEPPQQLFEIDPQRVLGLTIEPGQLILMRQQRQRLLGAPAVGDYVDPLKITEELEYARAIFKRGGFSVLNMTDKPVETCADEVIRLMSGRFKV